MSNIKKGGLPLRVYQVVATPTGYSAGVSSAAGASEDDSSEDDSSAGVSSAGVSSAAGASGVSRTHPVVLSA